MYRTSLAFVASTVLLTVSAASAAGLPGIASLKVTLTQSAPHDEVARMTVEELKSKIERNEPVSILDSRSSGSYDGSDKKIKRALRVPADQVKAKLKEIPTDKEIVIYCT